MEDGRCRLGLGGRLELVRLIELLHMDAKQLPVFVEPGHWEHGDRSRQLRMPVGSRRYELSMAIEKGRLIAIEKCRSASISRWRCRTRRGVGGARRVGP
jgi:hypothetical protein